MWLPIVAFALMAVWVIKGNAEVEAPVAVPPERPPAEHEVKTALADLRASVERLNNVLERRMDNSDDELRAICRQLDRIESTRRLEDAVLAIRRQDREV